jgi:hypothetical protein
LEEAIQKAQNGGDTVSPAKVQEAAPFTLANRQSVPKQAVQKQTITITSAEEARGKAFANSRMMTWENPTHRAIIVKKIKAGQI